MTVGVSRWRHATFAGPRESLRLSGPNTGILRLIKRVMVPGKFINLLPPETRKAKVSAAGSEPVVPVPSSVVPKFDPPQILIPDNFWSNLKQLLTARAIPGRPG